MNIYVASSWRNCIQPFIVRELRDAGLDVYDFKNPSIANTGFHWSDIDTEWKTWSPQKFIKSLDHPIANRGFSSDWNAMSFADACVLVMPCGRSAHLEAGYFVGVGKPLIILVTDGEPELMYKMATHVCSSVVGVIACLQLERGKIKK